MSTKLLAAVSLCAALFATTSAHADEPSPEPSEPSAPSAPKTERTESHWYGYQTLSTDGASIALLAVSASADSKAARSMFGVLGLASYTIAPVVVHGMHGKAGKGIGDLAIRIFAPVLGVGIGALAGAALYKPSNDPSLGGAVADGVGVIGAITEGAIIGFASGVVTAVAIDAAVLGWEQVPVERAEKAPRQEAKSSPTLHPMAGPTKNGFAAGLSGTF